MPITYLAVIVAQSSRHTPCAVAFVPQSLDRLKNCLRRPSRRPLIFERVGCPVTARGACLLLWATSLPLRPAPRRAPLLCRPTRWAPRIYRLPSPGGPIGRETALARRRCR